MSYTIVVSDGFPKIEQKIVESADSIQIQKLQEMFGSKCYIKVDHTTKIIYVMEYLTE